MSLFFARCTPCAPPVHGYKAASSSRQAAAPDHWTQARYLVLEKESVAMAGKTNAAELFSPCHISPWSSAHKGSHPNMFRRGWETTMGSQHSAASGIVRFNCVSTVWLWPLDARRGSHSERMDHRTVSGRDACLAKGDKPLHCHYCTSFRGWQPTLLGSRFYRD